MEESVYVRTLQRTAELLGGEEPLAAYLKVRPAIVRAWIEGAPIPPDEFLRCVDYLLDRHTEWLLSQGERKERPGQID